MLKVGGDFDFFRADFRPVVVGDDEGFDGEWVFGVGAGEGDGFVDGAGGEVHVGEDFVVEFLRVRGVAAHYFGFLQERFAESGRGNDRVERMK